ncbi:hypothetical protein F6X42_27370 [Paraburkholderia sp. WC7.3b]|uniref:Uncharacterized protein n=1 Tax=Paraburkholderia podalyriae TaxID=1938811 RepID=A0ABR7PV69_9BURK|nr:hypothetical protein [Paraburkholderia podalyriae]
MKYEDLLRDARNDAPTAPTRVRAAFDAVYTCCRPPQDGTIEHALATPRLCAGDAALVSKLAGWVLHVAPLGPLPMSPEEAVALTERVHKAERDAC